MIARVSAYPDYEQPKCDPGTCRDTESCKHLSFTVRFCGLCELRFHGNTQNILFTHVSVIQAYWLSRFENAYKHLIPSNTLIRILASIQNVIVYVNTSIDLEYITI